MLPRYDTKLFTDIYDNYEDYLADWKDCGLYKDGLIDDDSVKTIFFLLYAKQGNSPIANYDENQFKYRMWSIIFQYGPTWEKRLQIQEKVRELNLENGDLFIGTKSIYNHSFNPSTAPSTGTLDELDTINDQNTTGYKKGKLEAYSQLWDMLATDVTKVFIDRFDNLFLKVVAPQRTAIFVTDLEEEDEDDE